MLYLYALKCIKINTNVKLKLKSFYLISLLFKLKQKPKNNYILYEKSCINCTQFNNSTIFYCKFVKQKFRTRVKDWNLF